jgi:hypothetical protein
MQLLTKVSQDDALEQALRAAVEQTADVTTAVVEFASQHGLEFSAEELVDVLEQARRANGELSLEDMESVAGGLGPQPEPPDRQRDLRGMFVRVPRYLLR